MENLRGMNFHYDMYKMRLYSRSNTDVFVAFNENLRLSYE